MMPRSAFETALKTIEEAHLLTQSEGDRIHLIYSSVTELFYRIDAVATERSLLAGARSARPEVRLNFLTAIMYLGGFKQDLGDDTFEFLLALCMSPDTDARTRDTAVGAVSWSEFENASLQRLDVIQDCLQTILSADQCFLSPRTLPWARESFKSIAERKKACEDLALGRIVIPERVLKDLFSREGVDRFEEVGCGPCNMDKLARRISWNMGTWFPEPSLKRRSRSSDMYEVLMNLVSTTGRPALPLSLIFGVDRQTGVRTLIACYVGMLGTRPDLMPSELPGARWYHWRTRST